MMPLTTNPMTNKIYIEPALCFAMLSLSETQMIASVVDQKKKATKPSKNAPITMYSNIWVATGTTYCEMIPRFGVFGRLQSSQLRIVVLPLICIVSFELIFVVLQ